MAWSLGRIVLLAALAVGSEPPPLPSIPLASFTPAIRTQIEAAYRKARSDPADGAAAGRLGMLLHAYQQLESAEVCYRRARALDSADARWVYYLGLVQAALGKHVEAAAAFGEVVRRQPGYPAARLNLAESLLAAGRLDESAAAYEAALQKDRTSAAAHYGLGRVESARRRAAEAVEHYRKACELSPAFGSAHYALAAAYRDLGDSARAQEEFALYQKHRLGFPPRADPWLDAVEDSKTGAFNLVKRGIAAETAGEREASIREHERALELDPNYLQGHLNLISLYGKAGRPARAEEHYRAALRLNPNLDELHYNYGVLLVSQGKEAEAAEAFRKALEINPNYAEAHGNYAYILMTLGNVDEAERHYRAALDNKPN